MTARNLKVVRCLLAHPSSTHQRCIQNRNTSRSWNLKKSAKLKKSNQVVATTPTLSRQTMDGSLLFNISLCLHLFRKTKGCANSVPKKCVTTFMQSAPYCS